MEVKLDHSFCTKFRQELQSYGVKQVLKDLLVSTSEKVPLRKMYLARECKNKNAFRTQFVLACEELKQDRTLRPAVLSVQNEILPA